MHVRQDRALLLVLLGAGESYLVNSDALKEIISCKLQSWAIMRDLGCVESGFAHPLANLIALSFIKDDRSSSLELPTPGKRVSERRGIPAGRDRRPSRTADRAARARAEQDLRQMLVRPRTDCLHEARVLLTLKKYA